MYTIILNAAMLHLTKGNVIRSLLRAQSTKSSGILLNTVFVHKEISIDYIECIWYKLIVSSI